MKLEKMEEPLFVTKNCLTNPFVCYLVKFAYDHWPDTKDYEHKLHERQNTAKISFHKPPLKIITRKSTPRCARLTCITCITCMTCITCIRVEICQCRQCRRQCKIFASGVNFSIFTHFFVFLSLKLLKLGEIDGVKFLAWKSGGVKFLTNSMSVRWLQHQQFFVLSSSFFLQTCFFQAIIRETITNCLRRDQKLVDQLQTTRNQPFRTICNQPIT